MDLGLNGKRALVTASSQGLGRAIATELVREGCKVVISSRNPTKLEEVAREIARETGMPSENVTAIAADVTRYEDIQALIEKTSDCLGGIDLLVTNAGGPPSGRFEEVTDEMWLSALQLNLFSVIRLIRETLPIMRVAGGGKILNVSSISVKEPIPDLILSNTVRTGVVALLKTLALEVANENILIHNLAPGRINTERVRWLDRTVAEKEGRQSLHVTSEQEAKIPLQRYGEPIEFAKFATFLLSEVNSYTTGETIYVDGGYLRSL